MTDDPARRDDLASAHLDGQTTPEEASRFAEDAALRARLEVLAEVRRRVGEPPPPPPEGSRDAAVAAALDAFDALDATDAGSPDRPAVSDLPRRRRDGVGLRVLAAAAVLVVALALIPTVARLVSDDRSDEMTAMDRAESGDVDHREDTADEATSTEATADADGVGDDTGPAPAAGDVSQEDAAVADDERLHAEALAGVVDLGQLDDVDALLRAVQRHLDAPPLALASPDAETFADADADEGEGEAADERACRAEVMADRPGEVLLEGTATLGTDEVVVLVVDDLVLVATVDPGPAGPCAVIAERSVEP